VNLSLLRLATFSAGIAGVQMTLAVLVDCGYHQRGLPLKRIAALFV
jgi:hypothetical protein